MTIKLLPGLSCFAVIRNAISGDYPISLCVQSMLPVADEVLVADCGSTDGTLELLTALAATDSRIRVITIPWPELPTFDQWQADAPRPANDHHFWPKLINVARLHLRHRAMLHLDGDEILLPGCYDEVRRAVKDGSCRWMRRINFWQDIRHQVPEGHVCGTYVARLGPTDLWMPSDEQHPEGEPEMRLRAVKHPDLLIGHLGFLRRQEGFFFKSKTMQPAVAGTYDSRLIEAEATDVPWYELSTFNAPLDSYDGPIPEIAREWLVQRGRIPDTPLIVHLSHFMGIPDGATARRMGTARDSWEREYSEHRGEWNASVLTFVRDSRDIGDPTGVHYVRDMIQQGIGLANNDRDIIFLTNADVGFAPHLTPRLRQTVARYGAAYMRRAEFERIMALPTLEEMRAVEPFVGGDGFAFTVGWWRQHGNIFPDVILGRYGWDSAMKNLIRRAGGVEMRGELFHETHVADWNANPDAIFDNPANQHNRTLLLGWVAQYGGSPEDHLFTNEQLAYR